MRLSDVLEMATLVGVLFSICLLGYALEVFIGTI